jgi:DNA-directed RNA polymerase specialized sigma24 family protein
VDDRERRLRLERLFDEHAATVRAYALRRIDGASAEDTVMEVFVIACRRLDQVPAEPLPWLLACARRVLANQRRGADRQRALAGRLAVAAAPGLSECELGGDSLLRALAELSERDREVLLLIAWEGLGPAQAAAALECSRATLAVRLHRARRRLAAALQRVQQRDSRPTEPTEAVR